MAASSNSAQAGADRWHAVTAGFLGWTLDAFDFFVVIFLFDVLAEHFHVSKAQIVLSVTATLAMRPFGALIFGMLADRYGRRRPLMANVIFFSAIELLCGFAPNYTFFFILRMLFGIGMGGEWGVGASLAMEHAPVRWRGVLSGILQSGYSIGYLLAAIAARVILPNLGWRWMFWAGALPALLALYIRTKVPESEAWQQHRVARTIDGPRIAWQNKALVAYMVALMFLMNCLSHGTQDLYPTSSSISTTSLRTPSRTSPCSTTWARSPAQSSLDCFRRRLAAAIACWRHWRCPSPSCIGGPSDRVC